MCVEISALIGQISCLIITDLLETGHLSRHYIAEISLNVTLNPINNNNNISWCCSHAFKLHSLTYVLLLRQRSKGPLSVMHLSRFAFPRNTWHVLHMKTYLVLFPMYSSFVWHFQASWSPWMIFTTWEVAWWCYRPPTMCSTRPCTSTYTPSRSWHGRGSGWQIWWHITARSGPLRSANIIQVRIMDINMFYVTLYHFII